MQCEGGLSDPRATFGSVWSSEVRMGVEGRSKDGAGAVRGIRWVPKVFPYPIKTHGLYASHYKRSLKITKMRGVKKEK